MMSYSTLRKTLAKLTPPSNATYTIAEVSASPRAYAAIDAQGRPAILVETSSATSREIVRRGLRLQHRAFCHVEIGGCARTITASLVACEASEQALQEAFISVAEIVLSRLSTATEAEVVSILEELVELLERAGEPSREGSIGLFAELLVLSLARDPVAAVRAWRVSESDRYDIVSEMGRIEVKASGTRDRRHTFSLEQCVPDQGTQAFVASTLVLQGAGGTTVRALADRLQSLVRSEPVLIMKVQEAVLTILGLPRPGEVTFDEVHARTQLRWYDVKEIPAIRIAPANVDQVQFRINLASEKSIETDEIEVREPCLSPCLPL